MEDGLELVLADEHVMFLDGLSAVLAHLGHRVIATVSTHADLSANVRAFRPQICVTDLRLRDGGGIEDVAELAASNRETRVVVLTADRDPETLHDSLRAGAAGYVHKSRSVVVLVDALTRVASGDTVVEASLGPAAKSDAVETPVYLQRVIELLTPREMECLSMIASGLDTAAMAQSLGVSQPTVRSHVQSVLNKLGVHSRLEVAAIASRYRLVNVAGADLHVVRSDVPPARRTRAQFG
jgi:two-component system nitrate/nitrite response regulator NarL